MSSARCRRLSAWYSSCARDLPWRRTSDPYAVWVSEIMLQQTQVKTVVPRFVEWLRRFPDIEALAAASPDAVLKAWEGLGFYRRARLLQQAARIIVANHGGVFPQRFEDILKLPGIGRSTAGAIASICFGQAFPVLDGNVRRVLSRWHGKPDACDKQLWQWAQAAINQAADPGNWNQAMMELGATLCTAKSPNCAACPVASYYCASAFDGEAASNRNKKAPVLDVHWRVHLHLDARRGIWLQKRPDAGIWAGLWTPPITELAQAPEQPPCHIHRLSHRRLHLYLTVVNDAPRGNGRWVADLEGVALPTGIKRLLAKHGLG